ncbi:MAG: ATP-binding protein [Pseudomonadota bacterium]
MRRWSFIRWRIGVIVIVGLLAMASIPVAIYYETRGADEISGLPQPQQLAAIVKVAELGSPEEKRRSFAALQSAQLSVRVSPDAEVSTDLDPLWFGNEPRLTEYVSAMGGREFAAYAIPSYLFDSGFARALTAVEFRVGLENDGVLIVASDSARLFTRTGVPIGFPTALLGVLVAFAALLLLNREFRPVLRLAHAVENLDPLDPNAKLPEIKAGTSEVRALIETFQRQRAQVSTLLKARAALVGGIHHDVRTFATRLRLRAEKLPDPKDREQAATDIADLVSLMDDALLATRSEVGQLDLELIDFSELVSSEVQTQRDTNLEVSLTIVPSENGYDILGDRLSLRRILLNLTENAMRYGETMRVSLASDDAVVTLYVDDDGPGIPESYRDELMQPFSRLEPSRSRDTGGAGLGLSIVQALVSAHNGLLSVDDSPMGGARITVKLPRFTPSSKD